MLPVVWIFGWWPFWEKSEWNIPDSLNWQLEMNWRTFIRIVVVKRFMLNNAMLSENFFNQLDAIYERPTEKLLRILWFSSVGL